MLLMFPGPTGVTVLCTIVSAPSRLQETRNRMVGLKQPLKLCSGGAARRGYLIGFSQCSVDVERLLGFVLSSCFCFERLGSSFSHRLFARERTDARTSRGFKVVGSEIVFVVGSRPRIATECECCLQIYAAVRKHR